MRVIATMSTAWDLGPKGVKPYAIRAMDEIGIDISKQKSSHLSDYIVQIHFATLITVYDDAEKNRPRHS